MSLIRVFRLPRKFPTGFHFEGPEPVTFFEVDWFRDDGPEAPDLSTAEGRKRCGEFIRQKKYFDPADAYLVLHGAGHSFTIGYVSP